MLMWKLWWLRWIWSRKVEQMMTLPFFPTEPFGVFVNEIEDSVDLAEAARSLCTTAQIVQKAFNAMSKAQCYPNSARYCQRKTTAVKTWANFKKKLHKKLNAAGNSMQLPLSRVVAK